LAKLPQYFRISEEVKRALKMGRPIVALESTVISHGLPYPENRSLAQDMEMEVRQREATPATIAVLDGSIHVGINADELERLSKGENVRKVSTRDFAPAVVNGWSGGTTVAATLQAAHTVGIRVFATGGIGGVHRQPTFDISADLTQLARTPMVVVCAGAKAILDLPATLEYLETAAIPVVGYQTDEFPAFYSQLSGLKTSVRADSAEIAAEIARAHWDLGMQSAILVAVPPPRDAALPNEMMDDAIKQALQDAERRGVRGQAVTPFLLQRVSDLTGGASLRANLALLRNNARVAAEIACHLTPKAKQFSI
jgi:pseudouridine-5'-phosphate glycosidase